MRAADICTRDVVCIDPEASVTDAAKLMRTRHAGALVVVEQPDGERMPVGIVTDRDIVMSVVAADVSVETVKVVDIMTTPVVSCTEDHHLLEIVSIMRSKAIRRLPVLNANGGLTGMVAADDVYMALGLLLREINDAVTGEQTHERQLRA